MADDRLPCRRPESIDATRSDNVVRRPTAISLSPLQKASSRLTLVLCPAITIERLITGDFITRLPFRSGAARDLSGPCRSVLPAVTVHVAKGHGPAGCGQLLAQLAAVWPVCVRCED